MSRCIYCHGLIGKDEDNCYVCGDKVPEHLRVKARRRQPVTGLTNVIFLVSLAFTAFCFFAEHKLSLPVTIGISSALVLLRLGAERLAAKKSS
jgi:hypothetical protein